MKLYSINIEDVIFEGDGIIWKETGKREPLNQYISAERYERAMKFRFEADQKRPLCAGYLLNHAIKENYPELAIPVTVSYEEKNGKPYLLEHANVFFNLSHSGDYVVCVLDTVPVGIDIEKCKSFKENVARRFFAPDEYEDMMSVQDEAIRENRFYQYWVLKESFMKATGLGMQLDMKSFKVCMGGQTSHEHAENEQITYEHAENEQITYEHAENEQITNEHAENEQITYEHAENEQITNEHAENEQITYEHTENEQITYEHAVNDRSYGARLYDIAPGYCMAVCREQEAPH